jgi:hypothetical protein
LRWRPVGVLLQVAAESAALVAAQLDTAPLPASAQPAEAASPGPPHGLGPHSGGKHPLGGHGLAMMDAGGGVRLVAESPHRGGGRRQRRDGSRLGPFARNSWGSASFETSEARQERLATVLPVPVLPVPVLPAARMHRAGPAQPTAAGARAEGGREPCSPMDRACTGSSTVCGGGREGGRMCG